MRQKIAGLLVAVVALGACTATPNRSPAISPSGSPTSSVAMPAPSRSRPATPRPSTALSAIAITCGHPGAIIDLQTCLSALAVAIQSVPFDGVTSVSLDGPVPTGGWPPPSGVTVGATKIEVQVVPTFAYHARFESRTDWFETPLYTCSQCDNGEWGTGPPPSDGRIWSVSGDLTTWSDPQSFSLDAWQYVLSMNCGGYPGAPGGGTWILESIATDGSSADVGRLTCGPTVGGEEGFVRLDLAAGSYRLRLENVRGGLNAQFLPS